MNDKKTSVRTLTMLALLVAMSIVFSRVLSISTGFVRFNLGSLPVLLAAVVFGPGAGFAVGAVADIIGGVLAGYAINPLITLGAGAIGLVAGFAWQKLSSLSTNLRLAASVLLGHFVGSMVITSLALRLFYGYPWATLAVRIPNALILSAVNVVLLRKIEHSQCGDDLELGGHVLHGIGGRLYLLHQLHQRLVRDLLPVDLDALVEPVDEGRGIQSHSVTGGLQAGSQHCRRTALAVGARHMDELQLFVRVAQCSQQGAGAGKPGLMPRPLHRVDVFHCLFVVHRYCLDSRSRFGMRSASLCA